MGEARAPSGTSSRRRTLRDETIKHYLETIYYIAHEEDRVRPSRIAEWMAVSAPTVSTTLSSLKEDGWIELGEGRSVVLTAKGRTTAEEIVRSHRLLERWLTDKLRLDWAEADLEAQNLAPVVSAELADRLDAHLGNPTTCPHGNVIPGRAAPYGTLVALADLEPGRWSRIRRISEVAEHDAPDLLSYLYDEELVLGTRVRVDGDAKTSGAVNVHTGKRSVALGIETARSIWVEPE
ncbi:MAG TPA: metal-dependent transcriptional regulator [Actinomycetota bacterium]|nr:metal-dependent transcriptional regulator [Actinomycetota bacterium]